jgi:hypothetical protein
MNGIDLPMQAAIMLAGMLVGAGIAWGTLRGKVNQLTKEVDRLTKVVTGLQIQLARVEAKLTKGERA